MCTFCGYKLFLPILDVLSLFHFHFAHQNTISFGMSIPADLLEGVITTTGNPLWGAVHCTLITLGESVDRTYFPFENSVCLYTVHLFLCLCFLRNESIDNLFRSICLLFAIYRFLFRLRIMSKSNRLVCCCYVPCS